MFGHKGVFNRNREHTWIINHKPIKFPEGRTWKDYVDARRMEVSCGEAPYLVSRYDTVTGKPIPIERRIGLLDRKIRVASENTTTCEEWLRWTLRAFQSVYAYEFQGDSLLLARENLLYTFLENYFQRFNEKATIPQAKKIANVIAWNVWQMDAFTSLPPYAEEKVSFEQITLFDNDSNKNTAKPCRIFDWRANRSLAFRSLLNGGKS